MLYEARKGLLNGDEQFIKKFDSKTLKKWRKAYKNIAEGFRREAEIVAKNLKLDSDKEKQEIERHIELKMASAEGIENDVKIIDEELKQRGVEL